MIALSAHPMQHQGAPSTRPRSRTPIRYADAVGFGHQRRGRGGPRSSQPPGGTSCWTPRCRRARVPWT